MGVAFGLQRRMSAADELARLLPSPVEGRRVVSTYVRGRGADTQPWQYTLVPFSAGSPTPAPVYLSTPSGTSVTGSDGTVSAELSTTGERLVVRLVVTLDPEKVVSYPQPRVEVVLCPERSVMPGGAPASRLSVVALSLGVAAEGRHALPPTFTLTASIPLSPDGRVTLADVTIDDPSGVPVVAWIADGPVTPRRAYLGSTAGLNALDPALTTAVGTLLGIGIGGSNPTARLEIDGVLTVDTDAPVTGNRIALTVPTVPVTLPLRVESPWTPPLRPAVTTGAGTGGAAPRWRFSVAARRTDGTLSPPGAHSRPVAAAPGTPLAVTAPPTPGVASFTGWALYRSRLAASGWTVAELLGDIAPGATRTDPVPDPATASPGEPADPGYLQLAWGARVSLPAALPAGMALPVRIDSYDDVVPSVRFQRSVATIGSLPASGLMRLRPDRGALEPLHIRWDAASTSLQVHTTSELSIAALLVDIGLPGKATFTLQGTTETAPLAAPLSGSAPFSRVRVGWVANGTADVRVRVVSAPENQAPSALALALDGLPINVGFELALPRDAASWEPSSLTAAKRHAPIVAVVGTWASSPVAGESPTGPITVDATPNAGVGRALVRFGTPATTSIPEPALVPEIAIDLVLPPPGTTATAAADVRGVQLVHLRRQPGHVEHFATRLRLAEDCSARIRLTMIEPDATRLSVHARIGRLAADAALDITLLTVDPALLADRSDPAERPGELRVAVPSVAGSKSPAFSDVRVFVDTADPDPAALVIDADTLRSGASITLLPVPAVVDVGGSDRYAWTTPAVGQSVGARLEADLPEGGRLRLAMQRGERRDAVDTRSTPLDVLAGLPRRTTLRFGGDVGTLAPGSNGNRIVDPSASFTDDWAGRQVFWRGGRGVVREGGSPTELAIEVQAGAPPDPALPALLAWYRVGARDRADGGVRLVADGVLRGRLGAVADRRPELRTRLRAPTSGPKVRLEQLDDLARPANAADRGKVAAIAARVAATQFAFSSWGVTDDVARTARPLTRLLGSMQLPRREETLEELAERHAWSRITVVLDADRSNRSVSVIARSRAAGDQRGRDTTNLRLEQTPNAATIVLGPGITEIEADAASGPGEMIAEPAVWFREAPLAEAAFARVQLVELPSRVLLVSGWRSAELCNELEDADRLKTIDYGPIRTKRWKFDAIRIVASGTLRLGRMSSVRWDAATDVDKGKVGSTSFPALWDPARRLMYALSDLWFLELRPNGTNPVEAILHSPGEAFHDGGSNFQATVAGGKIRARIFKVELGEHAMVARRRLRESVGGWSKELATEIQMGDVEGSFAVGPQVGLDWNPFRYLQDDETTSDSWWWMAAYKTWFGSAQFGSHGFTGMYDAPWDPYWS